MSESDHCTVCSDAAVPMRVVRPGGADAVCTDPCGRVVSVAVELVAPVAVGDVVLVHAGVAIGTQP